MQLEVYGDEVRVNGTTVYQAHEVRELLLGPVVSEAHYVLHYLEPWRNANQETFLAVYLNGANRVIKAERISTGTLNSAAVHPRDVFRPAIINDTAAVILAYNHPSGTLETSPEDVALTGRLKKAGEIVGIRVLDHIVFTAHGYLSMKQEGIL